MIPLLNDTLWMQELWISFIIQLVVGKNKQFTFFLLPFWSPSLLGVPVSLCSNDSTEVLLSLLILPFAPLPELRPCPFLSPILPMEPWGPLGVWLPLSDLGSQGDDCDWLPAPPCFPWLGSLESICAALEGDITGGDLTMASCLDFGLLRKAKRKVCENSPGHTWMVKISDFRTNKTLVLLNEYINQCFSTPVLGTHLPEWFRCLAN